MSNQSFDDFVNTQIQKQRDDAVDWPAQLSQWQASLNDFYQKIESYLEKYTSDGRVLLKYDTKMLREDYIGSYQVRDLSISIGANAIRLDPIGTLLIGAKGRVDMIGPKKTIRFVLVPEGVSEPRIKVAIYTSGQNKSEISVDDLPKKWVWKISTQPPKIEYYELNEQSFYAAMMGVING